MTSDNTCPQTFDGLHHFGPRTWGSLDEQREVLACICGLPCPRPLEREVREQLEAVAQLRAHHQALSRQLYAGALEGAFQARMI